MQWIRAATHTLESQGQRLLADLKWSESWQQSQTKEPIKEIVSRLEMQWIMITTHILESQEQELLAGLKCSKS